MTTNRGINSTNLHASGGELAAGYPALLARAHMLAATIQMGAHGRRRAGMGDEFWQYRPFVDGDTAREIDWRRSARSDSHFVRQMEWQSAQAVNLWVDTSAAMDFASEEGGETKSQRAKVLSLAISILLSKAGERVGLMQDPEAAKTGQHQINKMALALCEDSEKPDYGTPPQKILPQGSRAVFFSDFLGPWDALVDALSGAADQGVEGCLIQILDPSEESFPFKGRTLFESMKGDLNFETLRANALRDDYLKKLAERQDALRALARQTGWLYHIHSTQSPAQAALLWLYTAIETGA